MDFKTDEIVSLLKEQLQNHNADIDVSEVGEITYVGDGVARVSGLENVMSSELVELPNDVFGNILNISFIAFEAVVTCFTKYSSFGGRLPSVGFPSDIISLTNFFINSLIFISRFTFLGNPLCFVEAKSSTSFLVIDLAALPAFPFFGVSPCCIDLTTPKNFCCCLDTEGIRVIYL